MAKTTTKTKKGKKEAAVDKEAARQTQRQAVLSLVETMHREKNISKDIIFGGIEQAIASEQRPSRTLCWSSLRVLGTLAEPLEGSFQPAKGAP